MWGLFAGGLVAFVGFEPVGLVVVLPVLVVLTGSLGVLGFGLVACLI